MLVATLLLSGSLHAQNGTFASPFIIGGAWGGLVATNIGATASPSPNIAGFPQNAPLWYKFTATNDGEVTIDTIGSLTSLGRQMDTVLAVYGGTNLSGLYQLAANDNVFPLQRNSYSYNYFNPVQSPTNGPSGGNIFASQIAVPFTGPSVLRFNAQAGATYYIAADSKTLTGTISLNWAQRPSGVFRFASEMTDQKGLTNANGSPFLIVPALEGTAAYVTVTRVGGSAGRCSVAYTITNLPSFMVDPVTGLLPNTDTNASPGTHFLPASGTLTFDDFEMSKTIQVFLFSRPISERVNRDVLVSLSSPQLDANEPSTMISAPRVDPVYGQIVVRSLSANASPNVTSDISTNPPPIYVYTNWSGQNATFNFSSTRYFAKRPQNGTTTYPDLVKIQRGGTRGSDTNAATIYYSVNPAVNYTPSPFLPNAAVDFPLSPGSEYAVPDPATSGNVFSIIPDFIVPGGYSGTLTFAANDTTPQYIPITTYATATANFPKDFQIQLYALDSSSPQRIIRVGMVDSTVVTIVFDDQHPPAGSVDQKWNADYNLDIIDMQVSSTPPNMSRPGTDGQVYGVAAQPDNKAVIAGNFFSYNGTTRNCIARINADGSLDSGFNPGTGISATGNDNPARFINTVLLDTNSNPGVNRYLIAGSFSSYNGTARGNVARLNANGSLDTTFNPGAGANGPVYAIYLQGDGKIIIGGDFTSYNGYSIKNLARLNSDGSLDNTFNPGTAFNGPIYSLAEQNGTFIDASRSASGGAARDDNVVNVGAPSGILTVDYDFLFQPDDMRVYYGTPTNGVLIYDTGFVSFTNHLVIPFGPTNGLTFNTITIVMNESNGQFGTIWTYTASVQSSFANQLYVGGGFTSAGGYVHEDHLTRVLGDGSLDTTFNPNAGVNGPVYALAVQSDGAVLVGGEFTLANNLNYNRLVRYKSSGALDTTFQSGTGVDGTVYHINSQNDGTFYLGGAFTIVNGTHRLGFARMNVNGTVDTTFLDTAYSQFAGLSRERFSDPVGTVFSSGVQGNGGLIIGGSFSQVGGGQVNTKTRPTAYTNAVTIPNARDGVRNRNNVARLIGGASAGPGNVGFLDDSYSVGKTGSSLFVNLCRTNGNLGYGSANFTVLPKLAKSGSDFSYSAPPATYGIHWEYFGLVNDANVNRQFTRMHSDGFFGTNTFLSDINGFFYQDPQSYLNVSVFNNLNASGDLNAQLQLANPANQDQFYLGGQNIPLGVALGVSTAPLTIVDDGTYSSGVFSFDKGSYTSSGSTASITIARTNGSYGVVSLNYSTVTNGSTAILGSDYQAASGVLNFLNGQMSRAFTVPVLLTNYITPVEKFVNLQIFNLQAPANGFASFGSSNAVLRIINPNFPGYLSFNTNDYQVNLSAGVAYVTVTRTVGSKGTLTTRIVTSDGTAVSGSDYVAITNNLQWNNGDVSPRIVAVPLINNEDIGGSLTFGVNLLNPALNGTNNLGLLGTVPSATVTINNDNNYGTVQFSVSDYTVNEIAGTATLTVARTGSTMGFASVDYDMTDGTATDGNNYVADSGTLFFDPGQLTAQIEVQILDDGILDNLAPADFYFNVALSNPDPSPGFNLGSPITAKVHLVDAQAYNRPPGSDDVTFNNVPGFNGPVFAVAQQSNGQLVAGGGFTAVNGDARNNFARLNADGTTDVSGFLNGLAGANGPVYSLLNQSDDRVVLGGLFTTINGVIRNRVARVMTDGSLDTSFNPGVGADGPVYALAETWINGVRKIYCGGTFQSLNGTTLPFLARLNNNGSLDTTFIPGFGPNNTVYAIAAYPTNSPNAGKVVIGGAFTAVNNYPVSYLARLNADGSVDTNFNGGMGVDGAVRAVAIQADDGIVIGGDFANAFDSFGSLASAHIARFYDDVDGFSYVDADFSDALGAGPNGRVDSLAIQADNRIIVAGEFSQANGVTRNNITRLLADGSVDPTINFGAGANAAVYATLVQPADQMIVIGGAFTKYNGQSKNYLTRIYGGSQSGSGGFEFTDTNFVTSENLLNGIVSIRRVGGTEETNTVVLVTSDGTAVDGVNYRGVTNLVVFPPGEVLQAVAIPVIDDYTVTPDLTVNLNLTDATGYGDQTNATLTIQNVQSGVSFATPTYFVSRNVLTGRAVVEVIRSGTTNGTATVDFITTTNGTATAGVDFYATNFTLIFNPGEAVAQIQIPILTNNPVHADRTVIFTLSNAVNAQLFSPTNTTLTIRDTNAPGTLLLSTNGYVATEGNGSAIVTVVRTNGSGGVVSVNYTTIPASAVPGINYVATTGSLTFGDGETNRTISVPLIDNSLVQGPVSFYIRLSQPVGATLSSATNAVVTVLDNDAGIAFVQATNLVSETLPTATVNIQRLYDVTGTASVHYQTVNGTAQAGVNYQSTSGTLNFAAGESLKSVSVPIIGNTNFNGDLQFGMLLSAPSGAQLLTPSNTVVIIQDQQVGISFDTNYSRVLKSAGSATITVVCANPAAQPPILTSNDVPLQVSYLTVNGSAQGGVDFQPVAGTLVFTNGIVTNTITVPIFNNNIVNGDRSFVVLLTNITAPGKISPYGTQAVVIAESNVGLRFERAGYSVYENGIFANINVLRTGYTNALASVNYSTANGTALSGVNYVATNGMLTLTNGVNVASFRVPLIANPAVQPNLTFQVALGNPTNAILVAPYVTTVTVLETGGSYVVPAGSQVVTNYTSGRGDGIVSSNDTVQVLFAFRAAAGLNVTNLVAYLKATNGVFSPSPASQSYGPLQVYGHSVSRAFTFTARNTNSQPFTPTFDLYDNAKFIGTAAFNFTIGTWTNVYYNTNPITIRDNTNAFPYPSVITVSGAGSSIIRTMVTFTNLSHTSPADISAVLVSPSQTNTLLMGHAGAQNSVNRITIRFDDAASNSLPSSSVITNGAYKPTGYLPIRNFP